MSKPSRFSLLVQFPILCPFSLLSFFFSLVAESSSPFSSAAGVLFLTHFFLPPGAAVDALYSSAPLTRCPSFFPDVCVVLSGCFDIREAEGRAMRCFPYAHADSCALHSLYTHSMAVTGHISHTCH